MIRAIELRCKLFGMADISFSVAVSSLVFSGGQNASRPLTRDFITPSGDMGQYSNKLYGVSNEGQPTEEEINNNRRGAKKSKGGGNHRVKCADANCGKDCRSPNNIMMAKLDQCQEILKKPDYKGGHFMRNPTLLSGDVGDYLKNRNIFVWEPHKLERARMRCWNLECNAIFGSGLRVKDRSYRVVEDIDDISFVIYPEYKCDRCNEAKSSLQVEVLENMGISMAVLKRCPVVTYHNSTWSKELYDYVLDLMPSKTGGGDVATLIAKKRTHRYLQEASIYLQEQVRRQNEKKALALRVEPSSPFPTFYSHCDGYMGSLGPSDDQINDVFMAAAKPASFLADAVMQSVGGRVLSADATFYAANGIKVPVESGTEAPVETVHLGK